MDSSKFLDPHAPIDKTANHLPHWHQNGKIQFITFRLHDSLPQSLVDSMRLERAEWLRAHPEPWSEQTEEEYNERYGKQVDSWLDAGHGSCVLRDATASEIMERALLFFNNKRYILHDYVIMPNHVHVLVELLADQSLFRVLHSWKSFTAIAINELLKLRGPLWQHESFDRLVRDPRHYDNIKRYIKKNIQNGGVRWMR